MKEEKKQKFLLSLLNKPVIINRNICLFLYSLLKKIFIYSEQKDTTKLDEWINKINQDIIKHKEKHISTEYSIKNLKNIIYFIKLQNAKFNGDIIENLLIFVFSQAFETKQDNAFCKYIFNNLAKIREHKKPDFVDWIQDAKIVPNEFKNLEELFNNDGKEEENNNIINQEECIFYNFLREILKEKYPNIIFHNDINSISTKYIYNSNFFNFNMNDIIYKNLNEKSDTVLDKDIISNSLMTLVSNLSSSSTNIKPINQLIRSFFTQVYIYYQNKNSPLMKYTIPSDNLATIPFTYDLRGACIEGRFSYAVLSPLMVEDFISKIFLKQNNFRETGLFEFGKILIFNSNIKNIECDTCLIKSQYLEFLTYAMGFFENYSIEEMNLSYNYLREFSEEFIIKILTHFKELKTLNISNNEIKKGLGNVFAVLKKLYRKKKTKLENLIINKVILDDYSFYELGELLKCKFCKLKKIVLNNNPYPFNSNFLKKLKNNRNLEEIYLNKAEINNSSVDYILRIISNSNIKCIYLFKNKLNNFNDFLRILYRTKVVNKNKFDKIVIPNEETSLLNLDLSNNDYPIKNTKQIELLKKIINETSLYCLDICHILLGVNPEKWKETQDNLEYKKYVDNIANYLVETKNDYHKLIKKIRINEVDIKKNKSLEGDNYLKNYLTKEKIEEILGNKNSEYSGFLISEAKKIIKNRNNNEEIKNDIYDGEVYETNIEKLVNYLVLKRSEKKLKDYKEQKYKKKLIII